MLDELDAPLDESNVMRFAGVLKEFIKISQFIIITHNKRTMELADVIYGITMQERGISKIVSVKFFDERKKITDDSSLPEEIKKIEKIEEEVKLEPQAVDQASQVQSEPSEINPV